MLNTKFYKMKNILIICMVIIVSITSCKKDKGNCYNCTFGTLNGNQPPPKEYCGPMPHNFKDVQGNDLPSFCVPK